MEVESLAVPKKQAEEEFQALKQAFKQNQSLKKEEMRKDLLKVYGHLQHGKKIIDIYESFKKVGLNKDGDPKLAIIRANAKQCFCEKIIDGSCAFRYNINHNSFGRGKHVEQSWTIDIKLPTKTFTWLKKDGNPAKDSWEIHNRNISTIVPIIPIKILVTEVKTMLPNYHILWEVEEWKPLPPKDPILLKRLTSNLFGVLATWDLTNLERAIIRGRILT